LDGTYYNKPFTFLFWHSYPINIDGAMYSQVESGQAEYKHWNLRGDLAATSSPTGAYSPAPITDAFGDLFAGARRA
jgi:hypothetical protein